MAEQVLPTSSSQSDTDNPNDDGQHPIQQLMGQLARLDSIKSIQPGAVPSILTDWILPILKSIGTNMYLQAEGLAEVSGMAMNALQTAQSIATNDVVLSIATICEMVYQSLKPRLPENDEALQYLRLLADRFEVLGISIALDPDETDETDEIDETTASADTVEPSTASVPVTPVLETPTVEVIAPVKVVLAQETGDTSVMIDVYEEIPPVNEVLVSADKSEVTEAVVSAPLISTAKT